jgi:hypothetical protein
MHFCLKAVDCFNYYAFNPENHVAEVIAHGRVLQENDKCCTDKLEIVREIPWHELLDRVNMGKYCTGYGNTGDYNSGNYNVGDSNSGAYNVGDYNVGGFNTSDHNLGHSNSGSCNSGNYNTGMWNEGIRNSGDFNIGDHNAGDFNRGDYNVGDWNTATNSVGCFCTKNHRIFLFDKPSEWTMRDWRNSKARSILSSMKRVYPPATYTDYSRMTAKERLEFPEAEVTGGHIFIQYKYGSDLEHEFNQKWWNALDDVSKHIIKSIPNFNRLIFQEITGIDVGG